MENLQLEKNLNALLETLKDYYVDDLDFRRYSNTIQIYYNFESNKFVEVEQAGNGTEVIKGYEHIYDIQLKKLALESGQVYEDFKEYYDDLFCEIKQSILSIIENE